MSAIRSCKPPLAAAALAALLAVSASAAPTSSPPPRKTLNVAASKPPMTWLPDTALIARVGKKTIRAGDFVERYYNSYAEFRPKGDSLGRAEFLETLINKEVVAAVAREVNPPMSFVDRAIFKTYTQRVLGNQLFQREIIDSVKVDEATVQAYYDGFKRLVRLERVRFGTHETAVRMQRDLVAGHLSWSRAWQLRLRVPGDTAQTPEVGWRRREDFSPAAWQLIASTKVGGFTPVIVDPPGFAIFKVLEDKERPLQPLSIMRTPIVRQIRDEKQAALRLRLLANLRKEVGLQIDTASVQWASSRFPTKVQNEGTSRMVIDITVPTIAPEDTGRVLATYRGGQITVGRVLEDYKSTTELQRPDLGSMEGIMGEIDVLVLEPKLAEVAIQRGYDRDSIVVAQIEMKREEMMVDRVFADSIQAHVFVPPDQRRKYYKEHDYRFTTPPNVKFAAFFIRGPEAADSMVTRLRGGARAEDIIRADSIAGRERGRIEYRTQSDQPLEGDKALFQEMKEGEVRRSGPDGAGRYEVLQLITRDSGRSVPFAEADQQIDEYLQQEQSDQLLADFVARHRKRIKVEAHPELLMRIHLAPPREDF